MIFLDEQSQADALMSIWGMKPAPFLVLYTIPEGCPKCKEVKAILIDRCIPFLEKDLLSISGQATADFICDKGYPPMVAPIARWGNDWLTAGEILERLKC